MGIDDRGEKFELSPDPLLAVVCPVMEKIPFEETKNISAVKEILSNEDIFGVNLYEAGLGETVENYFREMNAGIGAIRKTLEKYCN